MADPLLSPEAIIAQAVPACPIMCGVYFLIRDGKVVYVGQSVHISNRIAAHAQRKQFDCWSWLPCEIEGLDALERAYINALMPEDNRDHVTERLRNPRPNWQSPRNDQPSEAERIAEEREEYRQWTERMRLVAATLG